MFLYSDQTFSVRVWLIAAVCRILYVSCACPAGWDQGYRDSCYKLGEAQGSWQKDKHACESELLGHLLFVNNQTELNIVAGLLKNSGNDMAFFIYSLWGKTLHQLWNSHPNHCFALSQIPTGYAEVDASCDKNYPFVCERTTEAVCAAQNLPTVDHSYNDGNLTHSDRYTAGDVVTYNCHPGYALNDESQCTITCTSDHKFTVEVPECLRVCPLAALPVVSNSLCGGIRDYKQGEQPVYTCQGGYTFLQDTRDPLTCSADGTFTGTAPECKNSSTLDAPGGYSCEAAYACGGRIPYGCACDGACLAYGDCCDDYESFCIATTPSGTTEVTVVKCTPDAVAHSGKIPDQATCDYNTAVVYSCNAGYDHMSGDLSRTCEADGTWTGSLELVCFPNGTVIVNNPYPAELISAHASNMYHMCYVRWIASDDYTQPKEALEITGCDLNYAIVVAFSTREEEDVIQVGYGLLAYEIQCNQIDATGVAREFTLGLQPSLSTNAVPHVSPTFTIVSNFRYTSPIGPITTAVTVGEYLYWTVDIPEPYTTVLIACTAYAGMSAYGSMAKSLIYHGCTLDSYILQSFSSSMVDTSVPHIKRYYTTLWAFKFYTSDFVFFHCSLNLCPPYSTNCVNCDYYRKKRSNDVTDAEVAHGETSRVLRVDTAVDASSSATKMKSKSPGMIVMYVAVAWLLKILIH